MPAPNMVTVGVIGAPHGVRGAVFVNTALRDPMDIAGYAPLALDDGRELEILSVRPSKNARVIVFFKGVNTRDEAQRLTHRQLRIPRERLPELKGEDFYHADLIGMQAAKTSGEVLGEVVAVHNFGAGDVIEVRTGKDTMMVAFTKDFVPQVNMKDGTLTLSDAAFAEG